MQTVFEATGHQIYTKRNFWKHKVKFGEVQSVKFVIDSDTVIGLLRIDANMFPAGFQNLEVSISETAGDFDSPVDKMHYNGYGRTMDFTSIEDYEPEAFVDFAFFGGSYGDNRPDRVHLKPGAYYINTRTAIRNAVHPGGQPVKVTIQALDVIRSGKSFNQPRTNDRIEAKLDYLIGLMGNVSSNMAGPAEL